jgi:hypothetical protein
MIGRTPIFTVTGSGMAVGASVGTAVGASVAAGGSVFTGTAVGRGADVVVGGGTADPVQAASNSVPATIRLTAAKSEYFCFDILLLLEI